VRARLILLIDVPVVSQATALSPALQPLAPLTPLPALGSSPSDLLNYLNTNYPSGPTAQPNATPQPATVAPQPATSGPAPATSQPWYVQALCKLTGGTGSACTGVNPAATSGPSEFSFGRIGAFVLGLIFIAGGLYLFKPDNAISITARSVAKGARMAL